MGEAISIHAPRKGERQRLLRPSGQRCGFQSTLPARGSDEVHQRSQAAACDFNPRSPQGGATFPAPSSSSSLRRFQSTLPARGSDFTGCCKGFGMVSISIHAPRKGERRVFACVYGDVLRISIHAPRKGERRGRLWLLSAPQG